MRLDEALEQSATGALRRVASAHGLPHDDGTTRSELIERIAQRFADAAYVDEQVRGFSDEERAVVESARASAGELRGLIVELEHPLAGETLVERGWLYRVFAAAGPLRGEVLMVPDELLARVSASASTATSTSASASAEAALEAMPGAATPQPADRRSTDPAFSVFALVSALTRTGGHLEQEVRSWSEEPGGWEWDARWSFLQHLAMFAGLLVHRADGKLAAAPGLTRLLDQTSALFDRLWRTYLEDARWSELSLRSGASAEADLADVVALRRAVIDVVEQLPEGSWIPLDQFSARLQRTRPMLVREQLNPRGLIQLQATGWSDLEYPLLRSFVLGPLYWLGVVAASRDGRSIARRARAAAPALEACRWDDNASAELIAPARAQLGALLQAERYLVLNARGRLSRYHLVQSHVAAALGTGGSIAECRQLLLRLTRSALPQTIDERLATWDRHFGALSLRPAVLIDARSPAELDEALADERVRGFVRGRLGPRVAEVAAADVLELAAALRESGHLPRIDAALRLAAEPRRAYAGLVDEQVLEFLLVSLLAFGAAWPERLAELEGSTALLERLEHQFPPERLAELRADAERLAGALSTAPVPKRRGGRKTSGTPGKRRRRA